MKIKKRYLVPILAVLGFSFGPKPDFPDFDGTVAPLEIPLQELDSYVAEKESKVANLKPDNQARIIWADSIRRTPYSVVYIHGFSASPMEGDPIHLEFAERYGCNLYLARLAGHGIEDSEAFANLTPKQMVDSAKEALAIGRLLGEKVILMSCSTGGTLSVYLTAKNPDLVDAQILYSPNIDLESSMSELLVWPWGLQIARMVQGDYRSFTPPPGAEAYWTTSYRTEGLLALKYLLKQTMNDHNFSAIHQPLFAGYYYKNEEERDHVISVEEIEHFFDQVQTPDEQKRLVAFSNVNTHVIPNHFNSQDLASVREATFSFADEVLGMPPVAH